MNERNTNKRGKNKRSTKRKEKHTERIGLRKVKKTWTTSIVDWADPHPPTPKNNNNKF